MMFVGFDIMNTKAFTMSCHFQPIGFLEYSYFWYKSIRTFVYNHFHFPLRFV